MMSKENYNPKTIYTIATIQSIEAGSTLFKPARRCWGQPADVGANPLSLGEMPKKEVVFSKNTLKKLL